MASLAHTAPIFFIFLPPWAHFSFLAPTAQIKTQEQKSSGWEYMYVPTYLWHSSFTDLCRPSPAPTEHMGTHILIHAHAITKGHKGGMQVLYHSARRNWGCWPKMHFQI